MRIIFIMGGRSRRCAGAIIAHVQRRALSGKFLWNKGATSFVMKRISKVNCQTGSSPRRFGVYKFTSCRIKKVQRKDVVVDAVTWRAVRCCGDGSSNRAGSTVIDECRGGEIKSFFEITHASNASLVRCVRSDACQCNQRFVLHLLVYIVVMHVDAIIIHAFHMKVTRCKTCATKYPTPA